MAGWPTPTDLEDRLGRSFTAAQAVQADAILADAVGAIRAYTGQWIYPSRAYTAQRLKVRYGKARLPQRPVTAVASVVDRTYATSAALAFDWKGGQLVEASWLPVGNGPDNTAWRGVRWVDVTYTAGHADVPAELFALVCQIGGRSIGTTADQGGVASETIGSYSYSVGTVAAAGAVGLLADERAVLDRYRLPAAPAMMA